MIGQIDADSMPALHSNASGSATERKCPPRSDAVALAPHESAAHVIIDALVSQGITTFFGVPGGPISPVCQAILDHPGATFIESRHETSGAFAAGSYYRASGRVPALVVTAGPGATNVVTGVAHAHLDRVPMMVLCGDVASAPQGRRLLQDCGPEGLDVEGMLARLTRAQVRVARKESAASQALAALLAARGPIPGPALCVIPMDLARGELAPPAAIMSSSVSRTENVPMDALVAAADWLRTSKRPLLVIGSGCRGHEEELRRLVDALDIPFMTTPQAKGLVSERHPCSLRTSGMAASLWARRYTAAGVDAALVLGTDCDDVSVGPTPFVMDGGKLVHVDLDAAVFHRNVPTALPVLADVGAFASALAQLAAQRGFAHAGSRALMNTIREGSPFDVPHPESDASIPITPHRAVLELEKAAGPSARFISDIGEHMLFALHYLTADQPDQFHIHLRLGSMGSGIAGAVGLGLADPDRPVICICGDGGMQMNGMELLVAADLGLPIVYAVFNDARYNMVHHGMRQLYGREGSRWETRWVDFVVWASAMNVPAARITQPEQITPELLGRLRATGPGPCVLDIRIDRDIRIRGGGRVEELQRMSLSEVP